MAWYAVEGQRPGDSTWRAFLTMGFGVSPGPDDSTLLLVREMPSRGLWDSLAMFRQGFAPQWERMATGSTVVHLAYAGRTVRRTEVRNDAVIADDTVTFATPVFGFNQLDVLLRALPPDVVDTLILPLYSEGTGVLEHDTVTVSGLGGRPGARTWRLRFADPAIVMTATGAEDGVELRDYEIVQRKSGMTLRRRPIPAPR